MLSTLSSSQREFSSSICSWISNSSSGDRFPWATSWFPACRTLPTLLWCAVSSIIKPWKWYNQPCHHDVWAPKGVYEFLNFLINCHIWSSATEWASIIKYISMADLFLSDRFSTSYRSSGVTKIEIIEAKKLTTLEKKPFVRKEPLKKCTKRIKQTYIRPTEHKTRPEIYHRKVYWSLWVNNIKDLHIYYKSRTPLPLDHGFKTVAQGKKKANIKIKIFILISFQILNSTVHSKLTQGKTKASNMTLETSSTIRTFVQTWNKIKTK